VPKIITFLISGTLPSRMMSKDIILYIAGKCSTSIAQYKAVEFLGPAAKEMSIASRMTMSNMSVEIGAKFGFFKPDEKVRQYSGLGRKKWLKKIFLLGRAPFLSSMLLVTRQHLLRYRGGFPKSSTRFLSCGGGWKRQP